MKSIGFLLFGANKNYFHFLKKEPITPQKRTSRRRRRTTPSKRRRTRRRKKGRKIEKDLIYIKIKKMIENLRETNIRAVS